MNVSQISMFALSAAGTVGPAYCATPASDHPNIVIIMTDQQQYDKIGWLGTPGLSTPAMDRIAENGITFTNAYCSFPLSIPRQGANERSGSMKFTFACKKVALNDSIKDYAAKKLIKLINN